MKTKLLHWGFCFILCSLFIALTPLSLCAQSNLRDEFDAQIKKLEADKLDVESTLELFKEVKSKTESNTWFMVPSMEGTMFFTKQQLNGWIILRIMSGSMTASEEDIESFMKMIAEYKKEFVKTFTKEIQGCEKSLEEIKNDLSYYIDQKSKLNEPTNCVPYVAGTFVINGDPTGIMILFQSDTHVTGTYGSDHATQKNTLSGDFKCGELTGTYTNTEYNISGKFVYTFSDDGKTYSGTWWNDSGGSNGTNSGTRDK